MKKNLMAGNGSRVEVPQLPDSQGHRRAGESRLRLRASARHGQGVQGLRAISGANHHGVIRAQILGSPVLGLEAPRIGGAAVAAGSWSGRRTSVVAGCFSTSPGAACTASWGRLLPPPPSPRRPPPPPPPNAPSSRRGAKRHILKNKTFRSKLSVKTSWDPNPIQFL